MKSKLYILVFVAVCFVTAVAQAQEVRHWTINVGGGVTPVVGESNHRLDTGWNVKGGAGLNFTDHFGVVFEGQFNGMGVDDRVLTELNVPAGNAWMWSLTANPVLRFNPHGKFDPYAIVGIGFYRRTVEFTRPTLASTFLFDPWFGYFGPVLVPANQVIGSFSRNAVGGNGGLGFEIPIGNAGTKFYTEARYHYANTARRSTSIVPVTFGIRF